ncbi:MAG: hypothetical protein Q7R76_05380 [Candidatus Woesearchaeota archaeon]|nr:hypothetical protein [Candidatus Woesearchaeota archaeon]
MKCEICKATVETTFLEKILGSYFKDAKGKKHLICPHCQKKFPKKDDVLKKL